jgi:predicted HTH transcriptional regulator
VKELVGFANANGGTIVLGMDETNERPPRAKEILPIPRVAQLADRLKMACRDGVEVRLPHLSVVGIPTGEDGEGVIVLRVNGQSPLGPHRHKKTKEFYIRRNDETFPMTVEEIRRYSVE